MDGLYVTRTHGCDPYQRGRDAGIETLLHPSDKHILEFCGEMDDHGQGGRESHTRTSPSLATVFRTTSMAPE